MTGVHNYINLSLSMFPKIKKKKNNMEAVFIIKTCLLFNLVMQSANN